MMKPRGKRIAIGACLIAFGALAVALWALQDRLVEEYCLRRIDSPELAVGAAAWDMLARAATEHAVPRMLALLTDERRSDLLRARALHVLRTSSRDGRIGPLEARSELLGYKVVDAVIEGVEGNDRLAVVTAGDGEGVGLGDFFLVQREGRFVGALRVIRLVGRKASGLLIDEPGQRHIQPGDDVVGCVPVQRPLAPVLVLSADDLELRN